MKVIVDAWAWVRKADLTLTQLDAIHAKMVVTPQRYGAPEEEEESIPLYTETPEWIGIAREYFLARRRPDHDVEIRASPGAAWPEPLQWNPQFTLRDEQERAVTELGARFRGGTMGGLLRAKPGWGKTIAALALVQRMGVPALIVVHKEFLAEQWMERIHGNPKKGLAPTLPNARVGLAQEDTCDFEGKHLVIGMVHSLSKRDYPAAFFRWPGIVITDECHRIGARSWSKVPPRFLSRWRFGITATPRRKDGCERIFLDHIGPILFTGTEERLPFAVRRVWTQYVPPKSAHINAGLAGRAILLDHIVGDAQRNRVILGQLVQAVVTGRKVLVLSERLEHLARLERMLRELWPADRGKAPSSAQYVGGMTSEERTIAEEKQVIFATLQYVAEGLDIPALDTAFLTTPMTDVEQAIGRIQRPHPGKRPPVVVDFRDDGIPTCARAAKARDRYYAANSAKT